MANRFFQQFRLSLEKQVVELWADITFNGASAPTINRAKGLASISAPASGLYTFTFQDSYVRTLGVTYESAIGVTLTTPFLTGNIYVQADNIAAIAKTLVLQFGTDTALAAGTYAIATNPGGTPRAILRFAFSNTSAI